MGNEPWFASYDDGTNRIVRFEFEDCGLRISHGGYLHLVIFITTTETNQIGGELNGVGLTGLSGTGVLSDPRPAHHNSNEAVLRA
ncbi:hypothetical protein CEF57_07755 [Salmonella enterica]|nr:hypothetical protein [Salmonella enterica]